MAINEERCVVGFATRFLTASLAFIIGLAAHSGWDHRQRISDLISDFILNYQD